MKLKYKILKRKGGMIPGIGYAKIDEGESLSQFEKRINKFLTKHSIKQIITKDPLWHVAIIYEVKK